MELEVLSSVAFDNEKCFNAFLLKGKRVLTSKGMIIGKIKEIKVNPKNLNVEGIILRRRFSFKKVYMSEEYFQTISDKALILSIEPFFLIKGKTVINSEGKKIGKVHEVLRSDKSNNFSSLIIRKLFRKSRVIKPGEIKSLGKTILLKE